MYSPLTSHILGLLFPKERVPASIPQAPPREVGTTLASIVTFPVRAGNFQREYCEFKFDPAQWGQWRRRCESWVRWHA